MSHARPRSSVIRARLLLASLMNALGFTPGPTIAMNMPAKTHNGGKPSGRKSKTVAAAKREAKKRRNIAARQRKR